MSARRAAAIATLACCSLSACTPAIDAWAERETDAVIAERHMVEHKRRLYGQALAALDPATSPAIPGDAARNCPGALWRLHTGIGGLKLARAPVSDDASLQKADAIAGALVALLEDEMVAAWAHAPACPLPLHVPGGLPAPMPAGPPDPRIARLQSDLAAMLAEAPTLSAPVAPPR